MGCPGHPHAHRQELPASLTPRIVVWKEIRLLFSMCYERADFRYTVDVIANGDHRPRAMITDTIRLDALPQRFERLRNGHSDCKVMVDPRGDGAS